jgi:hypothetical protein
METEQTTSPWPRVFAIVTVFLVLFLFVMFQIVYRGDSGAEEPWLKEVRRFLASSSERNALEPISDAFERADWESLQRRKKELRELAVNGWRDDNHEVRKLIERNAFLATAVTASSSIDQVHFPPTDNARIDTPRPPFELLEAFGLFLGANARLVEAEGRHEEALLRLSESAQLGSRFCRPYEESNLSAHLAGMAMIDLSLNGMMKILARPGISPAVIERVHHRLEAIDNGLVPVREALHADADLFAREMKARSEDPRALAQGILYYDHKRTAPEADELARQAFPDALSFGPEQLRLWKEIDAALALPPSQQPDFGAAWIEQRTTNRIVRLYNPDILTLAQRDASLRARIHVTRAVCLATLGRDDEARALVDPYSGEPLRWTERAVYSVGPNRADELAALHYDPARGILSAGDIIAPLPRPAAP